MNEARIANGKVVEEWEIFDRMDLMTQLGHVPAEAVGAQPSGVPRERALMRPVCHLAIRGVAGDLRESLADPS